MHRTARNETTHVSETLNIVDEESIVEPVQEKTPVLILSDEFCEGKDFPIFFLKVNLALMLFKRFQ